MCLFPKSIFVKDYPQAISVKCGKCVECLSEYSTEWAYRIMLEAKQYKKNCFITLTYKDNPEELKKRDLQLFLKRLRKELSKKDIKIRYFGCGEYGKRKGRPHFHLIIFNWFPDDCFFELPRKKGEPQLFRSRLLEKVWSLGFSSVGSLSFDSAKYCAKYMQKLQNNNDGKAKPFTVMSTKPGLAFNFIDNNEVPLIDDKIFHNGYYIKLPRYFLKVLDSQGYDLTEFKQRRIDNAIQHEEVIDTDELLKKRKKQRFFSKGY